MAFTVLFVVVSGVLLSATLFAFLTVGRIVLSGSAGLKGDGLVPGRTAPRWSAKDQRGQRHELGSGGRWQMLVFTDHSLSAFPSVVDGIVRMADRPAAPDVLVVADQARAETAVRGLTRLGIDVPVLAVPVRVYHQYNVRVLPWVFFVDPGGTVRASSLVNASWQLEKLWVIARARLEAPVQGAA
jgi:hypothetical protein